MSVWAITGLAAAILVAVLAAPFLYAPGPSGEAEPILDDGPHVVQTVERIIDVPLPAFQAWFEQAPLQDILPAAGMVPAVTGTELITPEWGPVGSRRRVLLSDGSTALEQIVENVPAERFVYKVWDMGGPGERLMRYIRGRFDLSPTADGTGTRLVWTYAFRPRSPLARPHVEAFARLGFRPFLDVGIDAIKAGAEQAVR